MAISYTDGLGIEASILRLIEAAKDTRADTQIGKAHYDQYAVRYHLSPERANLLRHLCFKSCSVLEIGAGLGAVSRFLAEQAKSLTVIEGTEERFTALCERLRDLGNWRGIIGNVEAVSLEEKFDVVCVVGVLEYSDLYVSVCQDQDPYVQFLNHARRFLKPGGVLILAIENKLGLKYWAGAGEDHTGKLFDGICGYPLGKSPRTFSRKELRELLGRAGFSRVEEFFPFPDYKLPSAVLSRTFVENYSTTAAEIAVGSRWTCEGQQAVEFFPTNLAVQSLAKAGVLADFSNSFLFLCSEERESPVMKGLLRAVNDRGEIAWHYSLEREAPTVTTFVEARGETAAYVAKRRLTDDAVESYRRGTTLAVRWKAVREELVNGKLLSQLLCVSLYYGDWSRFKRTLVEYLNWAFTHFGQADGLLRPEAVDAISVNIKVDEQKGKNLYVPFDLEWSLDQGMAKSWFVLRNILALVRRRTLFLRDFPVKSFQELYEQLCRELAIEPVLEADLRREAEFQALTGSESSAEIHLESLRAEFSKVFEEFSYPRHPGEEKSNRAELKNLREQTRELRKQMNTPAVQKALRRQGRLQNVLAKAFFLLLPAERVRRKAGSVLKRVQNIHKRLTSEASFTLQWQSQDFSRETGLSRFCFSVVPEREGGFPHGFLAIRGSVDSQEISEGTLLLYPAGLSDHPARLALQCLSNPFDLLVRSKLPVQRIAFELKGGEALRKITQLELRSPAKTEVIWRLARPILDRWRKDFRSALRFTGKCVRYSRSSGVGGLKTALKQELLSSPFYRADAYTSWVQAYDTLTEEDNKLILQHCGKLAYRPLFSVVMPVYNTDEKWLRAAIHSVQNQLYPHWELCIADDASTIPHVRQILEAYRSSDPRIKVTFRSRNGHISAASNSALELAQGEFCVLLDHDDELAPHALYMVANELNQYPQADLIYSDEDKIDANGRRYDPHFKPQWNPDLFYSLNLVTHLSVFRTAILKKSGGFREGFEGSQDYDLTLRTLEQTSPERVRHIPFILYHWRAIPGSVALGSEEKAYAHDPARKAISEYLKKTGVKADVVPGYGFLHRVRYTLPQPLPKVSVIIGTRDRADLLKPVVEGVLGQTDYDNLELIIVDNQSRDPQTLQYLSDIGSNPWVRILRFDEPFNYSKINNLGVAEASGEILALLNNDLRITHADWLKELVSFACQQGVGAVGPKLLYPDGTINHAGVVLGMGGGVADHPHRHLPSMEPGYIGRANVIQAVSAVTGACLVVRRSLYLEVGGLDQENLAVAYNDVDFCLKLRCAGYRNIYNPFAQLIHLESSSRGSDMVGENKARFQKEFEFMRRKWGKLLDCDPYYSPNLSLSSNDFQPAFPPRVAKPWKRARISERLLKREIAKDEETLGGNINNPERAVPPSPGLSL